MDSTLAKVVEVLKSKGIDLNNNRFLILQGEVELISLMKPKTGKPEDPGLLEYLEDIIGTNVYIEKIQEAESKIDEAQILTSQLQDLAKHSESELSKLESSKDLALDFLNREKRVFQMKSINLQLARLKAKADERKLEEKISELETKFLDEKKKASVKANENQKLLALHEERKSELNAQKEIRKAMEEKFREIEAMDVSNQSEIKSCIEKETKLANELSKLQTNYNKASNESSELAKELPKKEKELRELQISKENAEKKLSQLMIELRTKTESLRTQKTELENSISGHVQRIKELDFLIDSETRKVALIESEEAERKNQELTAKSSLISIQREISECETKLREIEEAEKNLQSIKSSNDSELKRLKENEKKTNEELSSINAKIGQTKAVQNEQNMQSETLKELLRANSKGILKGICGRLGDLGSIDERYDIAITTAVPKLNFIVVETFSQAIEAVNFLRENRIGKAQFIALDKISHFHQEAQKPFQTPSESKRLFDLIRMKSEKFISAFYFAMKDTLVTSSLQRASQLGYGEKRFKVVTEQGYLIEPTGIMSGGGRPKRGGMSNTNINESRDSTENLENIKVSLSETLSEIKNQLSSLSDKDRELVKDHSTISREKEKVKIRLDHLKEIKSKINLSELSPLPDKQGMIQHLLSAQKERNSIAASIQKPRSEIEKLEDKIARTGGQALIEAQEETTYTMTLWETTAKDLAKLRAQIEEYVGFLSSFSSHKTSLQERMEKVLLEKQSLYAKRAALDEEASSALARRDATKEKIKELETQITTSSNEFQALQALIAELKAHLDAVAGELAVAKNSFKKSQNEAEKKKVELAQLRGNYRAIKSNYDFLPFLEGLDSSFQASMMLQNNHESLNLTLVEEEGKTTRKELDTRILFSFEVEEDLPDERLLELSGLETPLALKMQFEEEKLKSLSPNLDVINEYRERVIAH